MGDNLLGLSRNNLALVLVAVSNAGGSHEHTPIPILFDDTGNAYYGPDRDRPGPLYLGRQCVGRAFDQPK